jgi:hypothetical protein
MEVKLNIEQEDFPLVIKILRGGIRAASTRENRELYCFAHENTVLAETKYIIDLHEAEKVFNPIFDEYHKIVEEENKNNRRETYNRLKEEFKDEDKEEAYSALSHSYYDKY